MRDHDSVERGRTFLDQAVARANAGHAANDDGVTTAARPWPAPMGPAAFHGLAGEVVRMIEPDTESDPAAILVQFLTSFGALVGRGPHYRVEGDKHGTNLFVVLVGPSSKGRKGTSWSRVRHIFQLVEGWKPHVSGLSSGEGLKYHVRDAREEMREPRDGQLVHETVDQGIEDKRLLVVESEFANVLRVAQRQGSTLSPTIREAWDTGDLRTLTKNDPIVATGSHICIIGHITAVELRTELTQTDTANGFANRFLFVAAKRSKLLPHGGNDADEGELLKLAARLRSRADLARQRSRVTMTRDAKECWEDVYKELSLEGEGLQATVTARAEAQVIRLALVYCLLDGSDRINPEHLSAALAVWQYCDATAKYIFGTSLGDRIADEIMRRLRAAGDGGLTRDDLRNAFQRNVAAERIGAALDMLQRRGRATCEKSMSGGPGRPPEVWRVAQ